MKKKFLSVAAIAIVAVAVAIGVSKNVNEVEFSDLTLANVEALANGESGIPTIPCETSDTSCSYIVKDADGNYYNAKTEGMKRK